MNSFTIDMVFVIFLFLMAVVGYIKGFITRLYDFIGILIVLFLSALLVSPLSSILTLYKYDQTDYLASTIGKVLNFVLIFVVLFVILMIIKKIIGIFVKPILKKVMGTFKITSFTDKLLGVILSLVEALIISYLVLAFLVIPFASNGNQMIQETNLAKHVLNTVPGVTQQVTSLATNIKDSSDTSSSTESITKLLLTAKSLNLINNEDIQKIFSENIESQLKEKGITLSASQKQELENMLNESGYTKQQLDSIMSKISVGGE